MLAANHSSGEVAVIRGEGMPSHRHHNFGDMYVQFEVMMPTYEEFQMDGREGRIPELRNILPEPRRINLPLDKPATYEDRELEPLDQIQQARLQTGTGMEEEEEDGTAGGERVQCASQ